ncbi:type II toxin-antitoxin system VapC family toxin [bacterium]|nr:type II toxin-antitoxin system VapC family toxin [bacterium]
MRFWDTAALLPLIMAEPTSQQMLDLLDSDDEVVVWWGTVLECHSAFSRRFREGALSSDELQRAKLRLHGLAARSLEVAPSEAVRVTAQRLVAVYPLRAADSLQLAAALAWAENDAICHPFVTLDQRLRTAAQQENFAVLP